MPSTVIEGSIVNLQSYKKGGIGALLVFIWLSMLLILWGFAFLPSADNSAEWITRTQYVCFGTMANGMPAAHGWMLLTLSPLILLSMIWASHAEELYAAPSYIWQKKTIRTLFLLLIPLFMFEAHWIGKRVTTAYRISNINFNSQVKNPLPEDYLRLNLVTPQFSLVNQAGAAITQEIFRNRVTLLTFAFAHCSTICPVLIKDALQAQKKLNLPNVQIVVVTIDPWRDTPSSLPSLAKTWSLPEGSHLLSGSPENVLDTLKKFNVTTQREDKTGDVVHAAQIMLIDQQGRIAYSFLNPSVDWLVSATGRILNE